MKSINLDERIKEIKELSNKKLVGELKSATVSEYLSRMEMNMERADDLHKDVELLTLEVFSRMMYHKEKPIVEHLGFSEALVNQKGDRV